MVRFANLGHRRSKTDWSIAATKAGLRVLAENKDMLIIVSALFYGTFLCAVPKNPIHVLVPEFQGRLVYTSHSYVWYSYHFQVIAYVTRYFQILGILGCSVWFFSALSWCYPNLFCRSCRCCCQNMQRTSSSADAGRCCMNTLLRFAENVSFPEFILAIACTVIFFAGMHIAGSFVDNCEPSGVMAMMAMALFSSICGILSLLLWLRISCSVVLQHRRSQQICLLRRTVHVELSEDIVSNISLQDVSQQVSEAASRDVRIEAPEASHDRCQTHVAACSIWLFSWHCFLPCVMTICLVILWMQIANYGTYETFRKELHSRWAFLLDETSRAEPGVQTFGSSIGDQLLHVNQGLAPVWLGEFGTATQQLWWEYMMRFMQELDIDFAYWPLNGEKRADEADIFGIFKQDMKTLRHPWKIVDLQQLMNASLDKAQSAGHVG